MIFAVPMPKDKSTGHRQETENNDQAREDDANVVGEDAVLDDFSEFSNNSDISMSRLMMLWITSRRRTRICCTLRS